MKKINETLENNPSVALAVKLRSERFTPKQIAFILNYAGDPIHAAEKAGYKHPLAKNYLLKNKKIINALIRRDEILEKMPESIDPIMNVQELRQLWTRLSLDGNIAMSHRLKCMQMLAQSYGAFCEKLIVESHETKDQTITIKFAGPENNFLKDRRRKAIDVTPVSDDG